MNAKHAVVVALAVTLSSCGGGGGGSPSAPTTTSTPTPAPPSTVASAKLALSFAGNGLTVSSRTQVLNLTLFCGDGFATWTITESAGLHAVVPRVECWMEDKKANITDRRVSTVSPPGDVPANGTYTFTTTRTSCGYDGTEWPPQIKCLISVVDDKSNGFTLSGAAPLPYK